MQLNRIDRRTARSVAASHFRSRDLPSEDNTPTTGSTICSECFIEPIIIRHYTTSARYRFRGVGWGFAVLVEHASSHPRSPLSQKEHRADATLWFQDERWWLFVDFRDELYILYSDSPRGPWGWHRGNPAKSDSRSSRPAGRIFRGERTSSAHLRTAPYNTVVKSCLTRSRG